MKTTLKSFMLLITSVMIASCLTQQQMPISRSSAVNNESYNVEYLFEHDGCKVYRFRDRGEYIYFTSCQGDVTAVKNDSVQIRVVTK
jgi:hypothetical protein